MKVSDLTVGHIGQHITVTNQAGVTAGRLVRIDAEAAVMETPGHGDINMTPQGDVIVGRTTIELTIGRAVVQVRQDSGLDIG